MHERPGESTKLFRVSSPVRPQDQWLVVQLRHDGDIQVEYHIANEPGSPFESLFILPAGEEKDAIEEVSHFVAGLLTERIVLAMRKGFLRGGRDFIASNSLAELDRRSFSGVTSWLGTFDWPTPD